MSDDFSEFPQEKRDGDDRSGEMRETAERRRLTLGVRLTFYGALSTVEEWLDDECAGDFQVVIVGISDDLTSKTVEVMFENAADRDKFKANVHKFYYVN